MIVDHCLAPLTLAAVALYAALGFFLAPWLVKKNMIDSVREGYAAELRLQTVKINPFVLSLGLGGIELDDPDGTPVARIESLFVQQAPHPVAAST